jgi:hypothetical protein
MADDGSVVVNDHNLTLRHDPVAIGVLVVVRTSYVYT